MYNDVIEARFTSKQQDIILVLYKTDEDSIIEEYIEVGKKYYNQYLLIMINLMFCYFILFDVFIFIIIIFILI